MIGGGTLSGDGLTPESGAGTYTLAATNPTDLTDEINRLIFAPPALGSTTSATSTLKLEVDNQVGSAAASTQIVATPAPTTSVSAPVTGGTQSQSVTAGGTIYPFAGG